MAIEATKKVIASISSTPATPIVATSSPATGAPISPVARDTDDISPLLRSMSIPAAALSSGSIASRADSAGASARLPMNTSSRSCQNARPTVWYRIGISSVAVPLMMPA